MVKVISSTNIIQYNGIHYNGEKPDHCYTITVYDKDRNEINVTNFIGTKYKSAFYYAVEYILNECNLPVTEENQHMIEHLYDEGKNYFDENNGNEYAIMYSDINFY